ncbi:MAG: hypothetical protein HKO86_03290 [Gammaproteobacteria bacterium]|nr:hypothetical protein [Gammaproteobacteria bacterium]NNL06724.1 hypothetical protein [Gammaproteobacteria bacterium]
MTTEIRYSSLFKHVVGMMEKPQDIKCDVYGFISAFTGTTEYGNDYEIHSFMLSGWKQPFSRWVCDGAGRNAVSRAGPFFTLKSKYTGSIVC